MILITGANGLAGSAVIRFLFSRMHAEIEHHLEDSGVNWTQLRPAQFHAGLKGSISSVMRQMV